MISVELAIEFGRITFFMRLIISRKCSIVFCSVTILLQISVIILLQISVIRMLRFSFSKHRRIPRFYR